MRRLRTAELTPRDCLSCGQEFTPIRRSMGIYCSRPCANAGVARSSAAKRGDLQRGRGEGKSYGKLGGRHEHRVAAEQKIGRPLRAGEIVHHVDGNRRNNDPGNLAVMTQSEHIRIHAPWRWRENR